MFEEPFTLACLFVAVVVVVVVVVAAAVVVAVVAVVADALFKVEVRRFPWSCLLYTSPSPRDRG